MKKIIHIDMDYFFAAIEERDNPRLKGKPVAIGDTPDRRGVICTANYLARKFGIHSAMPTSKAMRLCNDLILIPPNIKKYKAVSNNIRSILNQYTDLVEPLSLDEAFLDVSECAKCYGSATWIAQEIRQHIYTSEHLTASAGISVNKFIAKIASDWHKPNGQYVVPPQAVADFIAALPVKKFFGVGPKTADKLLKLGITFCHELQDLTLTQLIKHFGYKFGTNLFNLARGIDQRQVNHKRDRKSLGVGTTFATDLTSITACQTEITALVAELHQRLTKYTILSGNNNTNGTAPFRKIFVKLKFFDFTYTTVEAVAETLTLEKINNLLIEGFNRGNGKPVRLLGVGVRFAKHFFANNLVPATIEQLALF